MNDTSPERARDVTPEPGHAARSLVLVLSCLASLTSLASVACTGSVSEDTLAPDDPFLATPPAGALRGALVLYQVDRDDGASEVQTFLRVKGDERDERRLRFAEVPDLAGGTRLDVWATEERDAEGAFLRVKHFVPLAEPSVTSTQQALINGTPYRPRRFAMILVDVGGGVNVAEAEARRRLFGLAATDASIRQYYVEASYGRLDVGGDVFGPLQFAMNGCDTRGLATTLRPMVPQGYDHYLWYMGSRVSSCGWTGLASLGTPQSPSRDTWYNASTNCVVLVQEPGHNFGMKHSASIRCPGGPLADTPEGTCTHSEYGDPYDPMGRGCRHMNAAQKAYEGWFGGCNVVDVTSTGTFTILPIEVPCNGAQVLQIPMPKTRPFSRSGGGGPPTTVPLSHYYVELRAPYGFDRGLTPQVQLRVSTDIRQRNQGGVHTWILDMNPATTSTIDGLPAGGTYSDPAGGIKITVEAVSATSATVRVEIPGGTGGPKCMDNTDFVAPGPGPESCAASTAVPGVPVPTPDGGLRALDGGLAGPPATSGGPDARSADAPLGAGRDGGSGAAPRPDPFAPATDAGRPDSAGATGTMGMGVAGGTSGTPGEPGTASTPMGATGGGGSSGGAKDASGSATVGGTDPDGARSDEKGGCGCRVGGAEVRGSGGVAGALLAVGILGAWRARRRDPARRSGS
jgi:hypothetical protein